MGNKLILLLIGMLLPSMLCSQKKNKVEGQIFYDKMSQLPVFKAFKQGEKIEIDYYTALDTISLGTYIRPDTK